MSGIKWVDTFSDTTTRIAVHIGHSEEVDSASIGRRMGVAARSAGKALAWRIKEATGLVVGIRAERVGGRITGTLINTPVSVQYYQLAPTSGELKTSYVLHWADRPCSTAHSSGEAESQVRRWGAPVKVVRKQAYWWGEHENGTRDFAVIRTEDITSSFR